MLEDPEFLASVEQAQRELNEKLRTELCRHGERAYDDDGQPSPCPQCLEASTERAHNFWEGAKNYMDGVKPADESVEPAGEGKQA